MTLLWIILIIRQTLPFILLLLVFCGIEVAAFVIVGILSLLLSFLIVSCRIHLQPVVLFICSPQRLGWQVYVHIWHLDLVDVLHVERLVYLMVLVQLLVEHLVLTFAAHSSTLTIFFTFFVIILNHHFIATSD